MGYFSNKATRHYKFQKRYLKFSYTTETTQFTDIKLLINFSVVKKIHLMLKAVEFLLIFNNVTIK